MQKRTMKTEMVMVAVPAAMLLEAGIFEGDPMQMYVEGRKLVIENLDDLDDFVCGDEEYGLNEEAHEMASGRKEIDTQTETKDAPEADADKEVK